MDNYNKQSWENFKRSGLLWWINMILHTFGWAIVLEKNDYEEFVAYPARTSCRGFPEKSNTNGYINVSEYMKENADELFKESKQ